MNFDKRGSLGLVVLAFLAADVGRARAEILLETADYTNALTPSYVVGGGQILGARFHVIGTVAVDHIGANFVKSDGGQIYGAITSLSGSPGLPMGTPGLFNPIAETTFSVPNKSSDLLVGLSATLGPGDYALVFGSNRFGATGTAAISGGDTDKGQPSTFYGTPTNWLDSPLAGARFVVKGTALQDTGNGGNGGQGSSGGPTPLTAAAPEPFSFALAGIGVACFACCALLWRSPSPKREGRLGLA